MAAWHCILPVSWQLRPAVCVVMRPPLPLQRGTLDANPSPGKYPVPAAGVDSRTIFLEIAMRRTLGQKPDALSDRHDHMWLQTLLPTEYGPMSRYFGMAVV
ncbi:hypothetical protein F5B20DRAFT_558708 [Whalleya microplaca]|nr:hypothetical protein F5B20DRAFT_558708 [Whalleya microplaca]